jgi:hypothetical protein
MRINYQYEVQKTQTQLEIVEVQPINGYEITTGKNGVSLTLGVRTSGGVQQGIASCSWTANGYSDTFEQVQSNTHTYTISSIKGGNYNFKIECRDSAGNVAKNSTNVKIFVDDKGPIVVRAYYDSGLKIVTSEEGNCRYSFNSNFDFSNATMMTSVANQHYSEWIMSNYYIKCEDKFNNIGDMIIIKPTKLLD